jgi:hypothetical protein
MGQGPSLHSRCVHTCNLRSLCHLLAEETWQKGQHVCPPTPWPLRWSGLVLEDVRPGQVLTARDLGGHPAVPRHGRAGQGTPEV